MRIILLILGTMAAAVSLTACRSSAAEPTVTPPNVLLIMTDDQGYGDLSLHGNPHLSTPHLDELGRFGVQFERFYVNSFCAPTRAALLTGRWPLRTGCYGVTHNKEAMRASEVTIAEALGDAGYLTACIGKWHNGEQYPLTPEGQGFEEFFGFTNGHWNNYFDATLLRGSSPEPTRGYITDVLTNEAIRFITRARHQPFFCYVSYNAPHSPYQVPDAWFDQFENADLPDRVKAFYGMCENIDDNVGRLLAHLDDLSLAKSTVVIFLTDNGGTAGVPYYNAGMRGGKTSVHEGGSRVPLFVRWPAARWTPHVAKPLTSHIDLFPTILDLCNLTPPDGPPIDGVSLRPLLEGRTQDWKERTLFTHNPIDETNRYPGAVRTERYRLVREIKGPSGGSRAKNNDDSASAWQLYDMQADPGQQTNIAAAHPDIVDELSQQYEDWYADIASSGLRRMPLPVGYEEHNPVELRAPQAYHDPPLTFANGPGFANDWLTGWSTPDAAVWFELDVAKEGRYAVSVDYACPQADAESEVQLIAGDESLRFRVPAGDAPEVPLPHRDERSRSRYRNRLWSEHFVGQVILRRGRTRLTLRPTSMPGSQVMELKSVTLERQEP